MLYGAPKNASYDTYLQLGSLIPNSFTLGVRATAACHHADETISRPSSNLSLHNDEYFIEIDHARVRRVSTPSLEPTLFRDSRYTFIYFLCIYKNIILCQS